MLRWAGPGRPGVSYLWTVLAVVVRLNGTVHGSLTAMHRDELVVLHTSNDDSDTEVRSPARPTAHKS